MSGKRRSVLEKEVQRQIEAEIGAEPDLLLLRNSVGVAKYFSDAGKEFVVPYGLGTGSPDLVGVLRIPAISSEVGNSHVWKTPAIQGFGVWFCLEVKADGGQLEPEQEQCHDVWRRFGAIVETVRSAKEARRALNRARAMFKAVAA